MVSGPSLPPHLMEAAQLAEAAALGAGLSFFEVVFEMLDAADVNAVAAYGGFPVRYASWRFGMDYERLAKGYDWGLSKIYELVINHDPTIAYLVRSNSLMEQKLVMAHVMGHADFFRNNAWFAPTERRMLDRFGEHARRIQGHADQVGSEVVERFLDLGLSLEPLVDPHAPLMRFRSEAALAAAPGAGVVGPMTAAERSSKQLQSLMNGGAEEGSRTSKGAEASSALGLPTFDVLRFLLDHADVESWQRDILGIVAAEAEYFLPQRMTKIINEGWASFWHSRLLTGGLLDASEVVEFADCHSGATSAAPGQLNPYKLGIELFRHAETLGMDLFQLRSVHNDVSFIDEVMDEAFIHKSSLFVLDQGTRRGADAPVPKVGSRDPVAVKEALLKSLAWGGQPRIRVTEIQDWTLVLEHDHDGRDLKLDDAGLMLRTIESLWKRPVELRTREGEEGRRLICKGGELRLLEAPVAHHWTTQEGGIS